MSRNQEQGAWVGIWDQQYWRGGKHGIKAGQEKIISIGDSRSRRWRKHWKMFNKRTFI